MKAWSTGESVMSFKAIGRELGLTRQRTEQVYADAIHKLRSDAALREYSEPDPPRFSAPTPSAGSGGGELQVHPHKREHEYPDWNEDTTRVVSGPIGPEHKSRFRGTRFPSRSLARQYWGAKARIVDEHFIPGRFIFRIRKEAK